MSDTEITETTDTDTDGQGYRSLSPPEYIKMANARESRVKHAIDLHHFVTYLQTTAGLLREMPETKIDVLIADFLADAETKR